MIKILQVIPYSYHIHLGGLEKIAQTISNGLNSYDDIELINRSSDIEKGGMIDDCKQSDTVFMNSFDLIAGFPVPKVRKKIFWTQLSKFNKWKPDIIVTHTRFFLQSVLGGIFAKIVGSKRLHIEHGSGFVKGYARYIKLSARLFDRTVGLWIFRQCDAIVTISEMHKHFIAKFTHKDPIVIYNPIEYTAQSRINNHITHIGFVGRLVPLKGVDLLIEALGLLHNQERTCTIVGEGPERKSLEELVYREELSDRIQFVGADDRVNRLHKFDIFVNPSYQEGLPTTVVEALMAGCLVIATNVGGTREISEKEDLCLIPSGESKLLAERITHFIHNKHFCGYSLQGVKNKFSPTGATLNYYNCIMNL